MPVLSDAPYSLDAKPVRGFDFAITLTFINADHTPFTSFGTLTAKVYPKGSNTSDLTPTVSRTSNVVVVPLTADQLTALTDDLYNWSLSDSVLGPLFSGNITPVNVQTSGQSSVTKNGVIQISTGVAAVTVIVTLSTLTVETGDGVSDASEVTYTPDENAAGVIAEATSEGGFTPTPSDPPLVAQILNLILYVLATNMGAIFGDLGDLSDALSGLQASGVGYDDSDTSLSATQVQEAIVALKALIDPLTAAVGPMGKVDYSIFNNVDLTTIAATLVALANPPADGTRFYQYHQTDNTQNGIYEFRSAGPTFLKTARQPRDGEFVWVKQGVASGFSDFTAAAGFAERAIIYVAGHDGAAQPLPNPVNTTVAVGPGDHGAFGDSAMVYRMRPDGSADSTFHTGAPSDEDGHYAGCVFTFLDESDDPSHLSLMVCDDHPVAGQTSPIQIPYHGGIQLLCDDVAGEWVLLNRWAPA